MKSKKYHTVRTFPQKNTTLSEHFPPKIPHCRNISPKKYHTVGSFLQKNTTLSEHFQIPIDTSQKEAKDTINTQIHDH
jgi:hypothetical protein